jgi:hypothetical protein
MRWKQGSTVSTFVSRNLEGRFLKTENLCGGVRDPCLALRAALSEPGGHSEFIVRQAREIIGKTAELFWGNHDGIGAPAVRQTLAGGSHWFGRLFLEWTRPGSIAFGYSDSGTAQVLQLHLAQFKENPQMPGPKGRVSLLSFRELKPPAPSGISELQL